MISTVQESGLPEIGRGSHVGWSVRQADTYGSIAEEVLREGLLIGEKALLFGPADSKELREMRELEIVAVDPRREFLSGKGFDPEAMYAAFRETHKRAKADGYQGLRVVADMDWLLPTGANPSDVIAFELVLDRVIRELASTVICAYRTETFDHEPVSGVMSVHPVVCGTAEPPFRIVAHGEKVWKVFGEVDLASMDAFKVAISRASTHSDCVLDISELTFIDVAGMRALATACAEAPITIEIEGASDTLKRIWAIAGCDSLFSLN